MAAMRVSGWLFSSTLMLSAPKALRNRVPPAEARNQVKSKMRMPCRGNGLPRREPLGRLSCPGARDHRGARAGGGMATVWASSFKSGARRPTDQEVAVPSHLLVA